MAKKTELSKESAIGLSGVIFLIVEAFLLLGNGGFFEESILIAGVVMTALTFYKKEFFSLSVSQMLLLGFSVWYFICSVKDGFVIEYASRGLIPFVVFLFWITISQEKINKDKLADILLEISLWIAVIAVVWTVVESAQEYSLVRLKFPFDYSNASGVYFAVCCFMAERSKTKFIKRAKYLFFAALLLTQSVGAIGVFALAVAYRLACCKKYKWLVVSTLLLVAVAILFKDRVVESAGTFLERLLHMYDGALCLRDNLVFGIGAGRWEIAKQYYQTGFYSANTIHSSIVQIGVNSGIIGLIWFVLVVVFALKDCIKHNKDILIPLMILTHSMFDFTLSFMAINVMLVTLISCENEEKNIKVKPLFSYVTGTTLMLVFVFLAFGIYNSALFCNDISKGADLTAVSDNYNGSYTLKKSIKSVRSYAASLYIEKYYDADTSFKNCEYLPTEIILYESMSDKKGGGYLIEQLGEQAYNTTLRDIIINDFSGDIAAQASEIVDKAADKASYFGKILYKLKGENL